MNDKASRLIGWPTIRQLRIKSHLCSYQKLRSNCFEDYQMLNEDKESFFPEWNNETLSSTILQAFEYKRSAELDTYVYVGEYGSYSGNGFVYEFRGRLNEIKRNLSKLHELEWINNSTRGLIIQMNLFNPNVQLFTSVILLTEFLSTGGISSTARFEPFQFNGKFLFLSMSDVRFSSLVFQSQFQLICSIIYLILIIYILISEIRRMIHLKSSYFRRIQSYIELSLIVFLGQVLEFIFGFLENRKELEIFFEKQMDMFMLISN